MANIVKTMGVLACAASLAGCASTYSVTAAPSTGTAARFEQGLPTVVSRATRGAILVQPVQTEFENRVVFAVAAVNHDGSPVNFGFENIRATYEDGAPAALLSASLLKREARNRAAMQKFTIALSSALAVAAAEENSRSYSTSTATTSWRSNSPWGASTGSGYRTASYTSTNPYLADRQRQRAVRGAAFGFSAVEARKNAEISALSQMVLQTTTIDPRDSAGGLLFLEKPQLGKRARVLNLTMTLWGEQHSFRFVLAADGAAMPAAGEIPAIARADMPLGATSSMSGAAVVSDSSIPPWRR